MFEVDHKLTTNNELDLNEENLDETVNSSASGPPQKRFKNQSQTKPSSTHNRILAFNAAIHEIILRTVKAVF